MSNRKIDALDRRIIGRLASDARVSNRQLATEFDVTEGTIRSRIKRLQAQNLIRFTAIADFRLAGSPNLVMLGIVAEPQRVRALADTLAALDELNCVIILSGRYNIFAMGLFTSIEQLHRLVDGRIRPLEGVRKVESSISVHNMKYEAAIAHITGDETPLPRGSGGKGRKGA